MPDLRLGLNMIALRFRQIEKAAADLPDPRTPKRRFYTRKVDPSTKCAAGS
jgi:hypothetical protein